MIININMIINIAESEIVLIGPDQGEEPTDVPAVYLER